MEFDADVAGMLAVANVLPSAVVGQLVERLIDLLDRRAGDPDFGPGDMEPDDHL